MILALGNSGLYEMETFQAVKKELSKTDELVMFCQDRCLLDNFFLFEVDKGKPRFFVLIGEKAYDLETVSTIWCLKPNLPKELLQYNPPEYRQFINRQFFDMRQAVWILYRHKRWLNDPIKCDLAENKIYQLKVACDVGFNVPETIITSCPDKIISFFNKNNKEMIIKILRAIPFVGKIIGTNKVTPDHLVKIQSAKLSPSIFQNLIPKKYDLRITVVGDKIFAVRIYSQDDPETLIDWRRKPKLNDSELRMEVTKLPTGIESLMFAFMNELGLQFGCIDMIFTPENEYVFLEINPNGQWYFVQLKTGLEIAKSVANLLCGQGKS